MHIFHIPSWYPHAAQPIAGSFIQEQITQLAKHFPELRQTVSLHAPGEFVLSLRQPKKAFQLWLKHRRTPARKQLQGALLELYHPGITWSERVFKGNINALVRLHQQHAIQAQEVAGPISLIHAHVTFPAGFIAWRLARSWGVPFVISEHMAPFPFPNPAFISTQGQLTALLAHPLQAADAVITVSPALAQRISGLVALKPPLVIPNIIDETRFYPATELHRPTEQFHFLCVAQLEERKGIADLLKAFAQACTQAPQLRLCVGGTGSQAQAYQALAESLGLKEKVRWLGALSREQVADWMRRADAFVLTSYLETFGVVYAEALASGIPVIATRCEGPESIVSAENGLLVPVGDIEAITQALLEMAHETAERYPPTVLRQDFLMRFSSPVVAQQIYQVYQDISVKKWFNKSGLSEI